MSDYRLFSVDIGDFKFKVHVCVEDLHKLGVIAPSLRFLDVFEVTPTGLKRITEQAITHIADELASHCLAALYEDGRAKDETIH